MAITLEATADDADDADVEFCMLKLFVVLSRAKVVRF
jgi:hypothetical protein